MKLTFIRNSTTKPNSQVPIPLWGLTEEGIEKARKISRMDLIKDLKVLHSSLQTKALETAVILGKPNAIPIKTHPGLTEITSFTRKFLHSDLYEKSFRSRPYSNHSPNVW